MKNSYFIVLLFALFLAATVTTSFAAGNNGQPFQALWDAIADLQDQIDNLSNSGGSLDPDDFYTLTFGPLTAVPGQVPNTYELSCENASDIALGSGMVDFTGNQNEYRLISTAPSATSQDTWTTTLVVTSGDGQDVTFSLKCLDLSEE